MKKKNENLSKWKNDLFRDHVGGNLRFAPNKLRTFAQNKNR